MVAKNNDTVFDFDTQGNRNDSRWRLGSCQRNHTRADNGLGVATIMAILESSDIPHPAIEALFTH